MRATLPPSPEKLSALPASPPEQEQVDQADSQEKLQGRGVKLELAKKPMRIALDKVRVGDELDRRVRVISLTDLNEQVELKPADGWVGKDAAVQVRFPKHPRARLLVRIDKIGQRVFLIVEPQMNLWADKPMPFTLTKTKGEAFQARREGDEFFASLAANKEEAAAIDRWLKAPGGKVLAEKNRAKHRAAQLKELIGQMGSPGRESQTRTSRK